MNEQKAFQYLATTAVRYAEEKNNIDKRQFLKLKKELQDAARLFTVSSGKERIDDE